MKNKIILICARSGSKGLKNKNLKKIGGLSLLAHSIKIAKKIKNIKKIIVSTDSKKMIREAKKYGADAPFIRPKSLSGDRCPEIEVWKHAIRYIKKNYSFNPDTIISLPPTSPLRSIKDVNACIKKFNSGKKYDVVITITKASRNPYFNMVRDKSSYAKILINSSKKYFRRQDAPDVHNILTVCYVAKSSFVLKTKSLFNGKIGMVHVPKERSIDIDDSLDLFISKRIYEKF